MRNVRNKLATRDLQPRGRWPRELTLPWYRYEGIHPRRVPIHYPPNIPRVRRR